MANYSKHGARGSMILNWDWEEDSQGVNEYFNNCAKLEAADGDDSYIVMTVENGKHDFRKGRRRSETKYKIKAADLITFIESNGKSF